MFDSKLRWVLYVSKASAKANIALIAIKDAIMLMNDIISVERV